MDVKELATNLLKQEFGDLLIDMRYWGPHEDEDLDVDVVLKEEPIDLGEKEDKIYHYLREQGFDVLFDYQFKDNSTEISKMNVKELTEKLIKHEFSEWLIELKFSGPFEGEDLDVSVILKEKPADLVDRSYRVHRRLRDEGFDVLIGYDVLDGSDEL